MFYCCLVLIGCCLVFVWALCCAGFILRLAMEVPTKGPDGSSRYPRIHTVVCTWYPLQHNNVHLYFVSPPCILNHRYLIVSHSQHNTCLFFLFLHLFVFVPNLHTLLTPSQVSFNNPSISSKVRPALPSDLFVCANVICSWGRTTFQS